MCGLEILRHNADLISKEIEFYGKRGLTLAKPLFKQTLKMDILSCKTPAMVRREVWTHLLGYNLVRKVLAQAALAGQVKPRQLSFAGAVQTMNAFRWLLVTARAEDVARFVEVLLLAVGTHKVGNRPDRVEPREVKRRPKKQKLLMRPRKQRRAELLAGVGA